MTGGPTRGEVSKEVAAAGAGADVTWLSMSTNDDATAADTDPPALIDERP
jgi:hypothetical protein